MLASAVHIVGPVVTKSAGGWETAVAIASILAALATIGLAAFTARLASRTTELALQTKALAQATATDIAGQHRPIVTTLPDRGATYSAEEDGTLEMYLYNSGSGPALDVQALLMQPGADGRAPQEWHKGALPAGTRVSRQVLGSSSA
jgi:type II secretory pathway pseudopilin PulG